MKEEKKLMQEAIKKAEEVIVLTPEETMIASSSKHALIMLAGLVHSLKDRIPCDIIRDAVNLGLDGIFHQEEEEE